MCIKINMNVYSYIRIYIYKHTHMHCQIWEGRQRVPGLPIRNYAGSCNSFVHTCTHVNARHVTAKKIFERLYLVPELGTFGP